MPMDRTTRARLFQITALMLGLALDARAQQPPATGAAPPPVTADTKITLDLRDVPFRTALEALFEKTGLQYAVEPQVPNPPVRLTIRDIDFTTALRTVTRLGGATYRKEGPIYVVGLRQAPPPQPVAEELTPAAPVETPKQVIWEKIPILFNSHAVLGLAFGALALPTELPPANGSGSGSAGFGNGRLGNLNGLNGGLGSGFGGLGSGSGSLNGGLGALGGGLNGLTGTSGLGSTAGYTGPVARVRNF